MRTRVAQTVGEVERIGRRRLRAWRPEHMAALMALGGVLVIFVTITAAAATAATLGGLIGAMVGTAIGALGALLTFGLSLAVGFTVGTTCGVGLGAAVGALAAAWWWLSLVEDMMLYHPRYFSEEPVLLGRRALSDVGFAVERIHYDLVTRWGRALPQQALLIQPKALAPEALWIVFGGNAMISSDWFLFLRQLQRCCVAGNAQPKHAYLLIDYPGYGANTGSPAPTPVLQASLAALRATLHKLGQSESPLDLHLLGHSLGAAAATQLAAHLTQEGVSPGRLVLSSPFTSIPEMASHMLNSWGLLSMQAKPFVEPLLWFAIPQSWGNAAPLRLVAAAGWTIGILHGTEDDLVPCRMGEELAQSAREALPASGPAVQYIQVAGAGHGDVLLQGILDLADLMGLLSSSPRTPG